VRAWVIVPLARTRLTALRVELFDFVRLSESSLDMTLTPP
jgi:hypothetical protein